MAAQNTQIAKMLKISNKFVNKNNNQQWIADLFSQAKFPIDNLICVTQDTQDLLLINNNFWAFAQANKITVDTLFEDSRSLFSGFTRGVFILTWKKYKIGYVCLPSSSEHISASFLIRESDINILQDICTAYTNAFAPEDKPTISLGLNNQDSQYLLKYEDVIAYKDLKDKLLNLFTSFFASDGKIFKSLLRQKKLNMILHGNAGFGKELLIQALAIHPKINKQLYIFSPSILDMDEMKHFFQQLASVQDSIILIPNIEKYLNTNSNFSISAINNLIDIVPATNMVVITTDALDLAKAIYNDRSNMIYSLFNLENPNVEMYQKFFNLFKIKLLASEKQQILNLCSKHNISFAKLQELVTICYLTKEKLLTALNNLITNDSKSIGLI